MRRERDGENEKKESVISTACKYACIWNDRVYEQRDRIRREKKKTEQKHVEAPKGALDKYSETVTISTVLPEMPESSGRRVTTTVIIHGTVLMRSG